MDKDELSHLKELAAKATPGPWTASGMTSASGNWSQNIWSGNKVICEISNALFCASRENAAFIAAASPDVVLALIEKTEYSEGYAGVLEKEKSEYYTQFDKLAEELGVFKETDPGKPETFAQFAEVYRRLKAEISILEREADWLANQASLICDCIENCDECRLFLECGCDGQNSKEVWRKAAQKAIAEEEARIKESQPDA